MMTLQHIEEGLSRAYVAAVAARAGVNISIAMQDYGVDGTFGRIQRKAHRWFETGVKLDYQLKASKNWRIEGEEIVYDLEAKTYNDLARRSNENNPVPLILILLCLPTEMAAWLEVSEEQLLLRRCCYWARVVGSPTNNRRAVAVRIPRNQLLTPTVLEDLLERVKRKELP